MYYLLYKAHGDTIDVFTRLLLVYCAKEIHQDGLQYMGYISLIPALGFLYIYLFNLRKTGIEARGRIWWNNMRPLHGVLYLLFAIYAIKKERFAWIVLFIDVVLGFAIWLHHYYT